MSVRDAIVVPDKGVAVLGVTATDRCVAIGDYVEFKSEAGSSFRAQVLGVEVRQPNPNSSNYLLAILVSNELPLKFQAVGVEISLHE